MDIERLLTAFASLKTVEAKQELRRQLIQQCLVECARQHQCPIILVGETSTRTAVKALAMMSQGRGFTLPLHTAAEVQLEHDVFLVRPLRDHLQKEMRLYNADLGLAGHRTVLDDKWPAGTTTRNSVNELTEQFIVGLDEEYPSTVSAIVRTVGKLRFLGNDRGSLSEADAIESRCAMCDE